MKYTVINKETLKLTNTKEDTVKWFISIFGDRSIDVAMLDEENMYDYDSVAVDHFYELFKKFVYTEYNENNKPIKISFPSGLTKTFEYNEDGKLTKIKVNDINSVKEYKFEYKDNEVIKTYGNTVEKHVYDSNDNLIIHVVDDETQTYSTFMEYKNGLLVHKTREIYIKDIDLTHKFKHEYNRYTKNGYNVLEEIVTNTVINEVVKKIILENDNTKIKKQYVNGKLNSTTRQVYNNGNPILVYHVVDGEVELERHWYNKDGKLIRSQFDFNGESDVYTYEYVEEPNGDFLFIENGIVVFSLDALN